MSDPYFTTHVSQFERTLKDGRKVKVGFKTKGFNRKVYYDQEDFVPLSESFAKDFQKKRLETTDTDIRETSRKVFLKPNKFWVENPGKCDIFGLDSMKIPEHSKIPESLGLPGQIIEVKGKFYKADDYGRWRKTFPPKLAITKIPPGEVLEGGNSDYLTNILFDPKQIEMGIKVELEHTKSKEVAAEIARDHLMENPRYYNYLLDMEKEAEKELSRNDRMKKLELLEKQKQSKAKATKEELIFKI